jgi:pimeloyl-ACP methyl ester carboxylesterase
MRKICRAVPAGLALWLSLSMMAAAAPLPAGSSEQRIELKGVSLTVFSYRPGCREPSLLIVLHGQNHNADDYRDWARPLADRNCMLVAAPRFDKRRFPRWRYQHGGIAKDGVVQDPNEWTGAVVIDLVAHIQASEGRKMPYSLIGHSAGGQFLSRLAAFTPTRAQRIVIANPGTHVFPDANVKAPYGFRGVYPKADAEGHLRRYLSQPVTVFLGQEDTEEEGINTSAQARAQGASRYQRGLNAFEAARSLAKSHSWPFNWRLVELPGVGHKAKEMFASREAVEALRP